MLVSASSLGWSAWPVELHQPNGDGLVGRLTVGENSFPTNPRMPTANEHAGARTAGIVEPQPKSNGSRDPAGSRRGFPWRRASRRVREASPQGRCELGVDWSVGRHLGRRFAGCLRGPTGRRRRRPARRSRRSARRRRTARARAARRAATGTARLHGCSAPGRLGRARSRDGDDSRAARPWRAKAAASREVVDRIGQPLRRRTHLTADTRLVIACCPRDRSRPRTAGGRVARLHRCRSLGACMRPERAFYWPLAESCG